MAKAVADFFEERKQCRTWDEMAALCKRVVDRLGTPIDPSIFEAVVALNLLGIVTTASCGGHEDHGTFAPFIDIKAQEGWEVEQAEHDAWKDSEQLREQGASREAFVAAREKIWPLKRQAQSYQHVLRSSLLEYLDAFYAHRSVSADRRLALQYHGYRTRLESQGAGLQEGRKEEERAQKLCEYQEEIARFAVFLKDLWTNREHKGS